MASGRRAGDGERIGPGTWNRCAWHLSQPGARAYELSYVRSNTMPKSPFSAPYVVEYRPTATMPGARHAFNGEHFGAGAEPAQQGTQFDAIGHFAVLPTPADAQSSGGYERRRLLRQVHAAGEAEAGLAPAATRRREGATVGSHGGAARCKALRKRWPADAGGPGRYPREYRGDARGAGVARAGCPAG
jgi:hypothetical protein